MKEIKVWANSMLEKSKKGMGIWDMLPAVMAFVLIGLIAGAGALGLGGFLNNTNATEQPIVAQILNNSLGALSTLSSWQTTIATIVAAAILVTIVLGSFGYLGAGNMQGGSR